MFELIALCGRFLGFGCGLFVLSAVRLAYLVLGAVERTSFHAVFTHNAAFDCGTVFSEYGVVTALQHFQSHGLAVLALSSVNVTSWVHGKLSILVTTGSFDFVPSFLTLVFLVGNHLLVSVHQIQVLFYVFWRDILALLGRENSRALLVLRVDSSPLWRASSGRNRV